MNEGTCICFVLFCIFRYYKRIDISSKRVEFLADMKKCHLLLIRMKKGIPPSVSKDIVISLTDRINSSGGNIEIKYPLRYVDKYDDELVEIMIALVGEVINFSKRYSFRNRLGNIFDRLLALHNIPRALLNSSSWDASVPQFFCMTKQEVLECIVMSLGDTWCNKEAGEYQGFN